VAEKYGLIAELDRWVIKRGIQIAAQGRHVGINLSAESVVTNDLSTFIEREISETGADPQPRLRNHRNGFDARHRKDAPSLRESQNLVAASPWTILERALERLPI